MPLWALIALIVFALAVVFLVGGYIVTRRRREAPDWAAHVAQADSHLEEARAADKGWDRAILEQAAREALARQRPGWSYSRLHLVLVDDKPGVEEDKAHMVATGDGDDVRVVLARDASGNWRTDAVS
jgi:hypothetical protein